MLNDLEAKIKLMWYSLDAFNEPHEVSSAVPYHRVTPTSVSAWVDFTTALSIEKLDYVAAGLVNNIASIKDHLKNWCIKNNKKFEGDDLINNNLDVALVHDLWNIGKHATLSKPPRSGHVPKINNLRSILRLTVAEPNSFVSYSIDPKTGQPITSQGGGGSAAIRITGDVVNEHGVRLGDFGEICEKAVAAWEQALQKAGVPMTLR